MHFMLHIHNPAFASKCKSEYYMEKGDREMACIHTSRQPTNVRAEWESQETDIKKILI